MDWFLVQIGRTFRMDESSYSNERLETVFARSLLINILHLLSRMVWLVRHSIKPSPLLAIILRKLSEQPLPIPTALTLVSFRLRLVVNSLSRTAYSFRFPLLIMITLLGYGMSNSISNIAFKRGDISMPPIGSRLDLI